MDTTLTIICIAIVVIIIITSVGILTRKKVIQSLDNNKWIEGFLILCLVGCILTLAYIGYDTLPKD